MPWRDFIITKQSRKSSTISCVPQGVLAVCISFALAGCNWTALSSVSSTGEQGNGPSHRSSVSANGRYVAFQSDASNLVPGDTNNASDIFVRDLLEGSTTRVSVDSDEMEANFEYFSDGSYYPSISADGRYVAYCSGANNLVAGDTNGAWDIFVRDTVAGTTTRVNVNSAGAQAIGVGTESREPSISADGRYVAFASSAGNLVEGDTNGDYDVFVRDTVDGIITRVSVSNAGTEGNTGSGSSSSISDDGRYVAFSSYASNLVPNDTNGSTDVFVRDLVAGTTTRVSLSSEEVQSFPYWSSEPAISGDGRYVAFNSLAFNLVAGDSNYTYDIFVRDMVYGTTTRVSVDSAGVEANGSSFEPSISRDGRYVAFHSQASNLVDNDTNDTYLFDIFVRDTVAGTTTRASLDAFGVEGTSGGYNPSISGDGRYVAFGTGSTLIPEDVNGFEDIVFRAIPVVTVTAISPDRLTIGATTRVTITGANFLTGATPVVGSAQISNTVIVNETTMITDVIVPANSLSDVQDVLVGLPGTGPGPLTGSIGACLDCATFSPAPGC